MFFLQSIVTDFRNYSKIKINVGVWDRFSVLPGLLVGWGCFFWRAQFILQEKDGNSPIFRYSGVGGRPE